MLFQRFLRIIPGIFTTVPPRISAEVFLSHVVSSKMPLEICSSGFSGIASRVSSGYPSRDHSKIIPKILQRWLSGYRMFASEEKLPICLSADDINSTLYRRRQKKKDQILTARGVETPRTCHNMFASGQQPMRARLAWVGGQIWMLGGMYITYRAFVKL